jgi:hypothetical protein
VRLGITLYRHPGLQLVLLLALPLLWFVLVYLGSLCTCWPKAYSLLTTSPCRSAGN